MTNEFTNIDEGGSRHELVGNESMAKVVDLGVFNSSDAEIAVNATSNVSN